MKPSTTTTRASSRSASSVGLDPSNNQALPSNATSAWIDGWLSRRAAGERYGVPDTAIEDGPPLLQSVGAEGGGRCGFASVGSASCNAIKYSPRVASSLVYMNV